MNSKERGAQGRSAKDSLQGHEKYGHVIIFAKVPLEVLYLYLQPGDRARIWNKDVAERSRRKDKMGIN